MAKILVVDDTADNRALVRFIFGHRGDEVSEARDGEEALELARAEPPDLIISDILMPSMDGYEFVRRLRADPVLKKTPVIFWSAYYLEQEARALAESCGVTHLISKPAEPETILATVDAALGVGRQAVAPAEDFDREHLRLVTDQLARRVEQLSAVSGRLSALTAVTHRLAMETQPRRILDGYCEAAREIVGARFSGLLVVDADGLTPSHFRTSGVEPGGTDRRGDAADSAGLIALFEPTRGPLHLAVDDAQARALGVAAAAVGGRVMLLVVPVLSPSHAYGWLYLAGKLGLEDFGEEDERLADSLAGQLAVSYENALRYDEIQRHSSALEAEVVQRREAERRLAAQYAVSEVLAGNDAAERAGPAILQIVATCLGWQDGTLWLVDRAAGRLRRAARWVPAADGTEPPAVPDGAAELVKGEDLAGQVWLEKKPRLVRAADRPDHRSACAFPITFQGNILAIMEFATGTTAVLARDVAAMLSGICNHVGVYLERKRAEAELERITRARKVMAKCNHVLVHADEEAQLLLDMCRVVVEDGGYRMAWVGYDSNGSGEAIRPVARAGLGASEIGTAERDGLVEAIRAPSRQAIRLAQTTTVRDVAGTADSGPRSCIGAARDFRSTVALPLRDGSKAFGALTIFDSVPDAFADDEVTLLEELANDISYGVVSLRTRAARDNAEQRLAVQYAVIRALAESTGVDQAAPRILDAVCTTLRWDVGELWLVDAGSSLLRRHASWQGGGFAAGELASFDQVTTLSPGQGLPGRVWVAKIPVWIADLQHEPLPKGPRQAVSVGLQAAFCYPLMFERKILGVMALFCRSIRQHDDELVNMLAATGNQIGAFIERRRAESALHVAEERLGSILESIDNVVWSARAADGQLLYLNPAAERVYGRPVADFFAHPGLWAECIHGEDRQRIAGSAELLITLGAMTRDYRIVRPDGQVRWLEDRVRVVLDEAGSPLRFDGAISDITERKDYEERIEYLATHDALTGLPNRNLLNDRIGQAILHANRTGGHFALLFIDVDRFKLINDSFGHPLGDQFLREVARRLEQIVRDGDTVARLGGDEFVLLLPEMRRVDDASHIAVKVLESIARPYVIEGRELFASASIGVAVHPEDGHVGELLLRNADTAMYRAKEQGRNGFQFYTRKMSQEAQERVDLENALRHALKAGEFELAYQPKVDLRSGRITGLEALVRWHRPGVGQVAPSRFISFAEENGLIGPIGEWVLRKACAQAREWVDTLQADLVVAVNVSAQQFQQQRIAGLVERVLRESGLGAQHLELEFTESVLMGEDESLMRTIRELKELGVRLSIDDFGTGYSSLSYLKRFPIDSLKIDQSFVREITTDPDSEAIAGTIVAMAHSLKLKVIAEGVENVAQLELLATQGCDEVQGYYFSPPISAARCADFLGAERRLPVPGRAGTAEAGGTGKAGRR